MSAWFMVMIFITPITFLMAADRIFKVFILQFQAYEFIFNKSNHMFLKCS